MTRPRPGESFERFAIRRVFETGHFWGPDNPGGHAVSESDLFKLKISDPEVVKGLISFAKSNTAVYTSICVKKHNRLPMFDGTVGPAMTDFLQVNRCPVPDYAPPPGVVATFEDPYLQEVFNTLQQQQAMAVGSGNWAKCHGITDAHCAVVEVDQTNMPEFLRPLFPQVLRKVQFAYSQVGLLFLFTSKNRDLLTGNRVDANINIDMSFVNNSSGWIGLAIVGQGQTCSSRIWCRYLATYRGGNTEQDIINQWVTLIMHELGHNAGRGHTNGGVMNPTLVNGLPGIWTPQDPSTAWMRGQFGGVAIPGGTPEPQPPEDPPDQDPIAYLMLQNQIRGLQFEMIMDQLRDIRSKLR